MAVERYESNSTAILAAMSCEAKMLHSSPTYSASQVPRRRMELSDMYDMEESP